MKTILFCIIILIPAFSWAQRFFPVSVDAAREYKVHQQDSIVDHFDEMLPVRANLSVTNWGEDPNHMYDFRFAQTHKRGDTIYVKIYETHTLFDYTYDLKIVRDKFSVSFWYQTTMDSGDRKIETVESKLILKNKVVKNQSVLIGYTEYKGRCTRYCSEPDEIYIVRGTFKIPLK